MSDIVADLLERHYEVKKRVDNEKHTYRITVLTRHEELGLLMLAEFDRLSNVSVC